MQFEKQSIPEIILIKPELFPDERGYIFESFQEKKFFQNEVNLKIVQQNQSGSKKGIIRGLHFQIQQSQGKLIKVLNGEIFDVAVDLRKFSSTFGKWVGLILDSKKFHQLWIPPGFAHGFLVLSDWAEILYGASDFYAPEYERTLIWNDPEIGIEWPIEKDFVPVLSSKDLNGKKLKDIEVYGE